MTDIKYKHQYTCPVCGKKYVKGKYFQKHLRRCLRENPNYRKEKKLE